METRQTRSWILAIAAMGLAVAGCLPDWWPTGPQTPPIAATDEVEPNESVTDATLVGFDESGRARLVGSIPPLVERLDADFYNLGPMTAGDRIVVDVAVTSGDLDAMIAIFDADSRLFITNDKTGTEAGLNNPHIDERFRRNSDKYYLLVARSAFSPRTSGGYEVTVQVERGGEVPEARPQVFLLNFAGGTITLPDGTQTTLAPFDAAGIANMYEGQTEVIERSIIETFRQNYARYNVETLNTLDDVPPADGVYSTIHFGGYDPKGLGLALKGTDPYNHDPADSAVVFTERFSPKLFTTPPTAEQLGGAIGNIAAHEAGHLLGLNHVRDSANIMNTYDAPNNLLRDQQFKRSTLDRLIIPLFLFTLEQDGDLLLEETVGRRTPVADETLTIGAEPSAVAAMWNLGGYADLVAVGAVNSEFWMLPNNGGGVFTPDGPYYVGLGPTDVVAADFDGDPHIDVAIANLGDNTVIVLKNDGQGSFIVAAEVGVSEGPVAITSGDFNGDGHLDFATVSAFNGEVSVALNNGNATFGSSTLIGTGEFPLSIAAGDLDGDGRTDIAIATTGSQTKPGDATVFLNNGDGTYTTRFVNAGNGVPRDIAIEDFNGDGAQDVVVVDTYIGGAYVMLNNQEGGFASPVLAVAGEAAASVVAADLDGDGDPDLAVSNSGSNDVSILRNRGDGTFEPEWPYGVGHTPGSITAADFDRDGDIDLAVVNEQDGTISILLNHGDGIFGGTP